MTREPRPDPSEPRRLVHIDRGAAGVDGAVDAELAFHFEMSVRGLMSEGRTREEAEREALQRFGDVSATRDRLRYIDRAATRRTGVAEWWSSVIQDLRYTARGVRLNAGFAALVALTLALGIGATATMFGIVDRLLLRAPDHLVDATSLRRVYAHVRSKSSGEFTTSILGYSAYAALRGQRAIVSQAAAYQVGDARIGRGIDAVTGSLGAATGDFFSMLGVRPVRGRFFGVAEDQPPDGAHVVVLDHGYWRREFGAADSAIGRTLVVNDVPFTIIGIAPAGFTGVELRPVDLWIPVSAGAHPTPDWWTTWRAQWLNVIVRVKPGVSAQQADERLTVAFRNAYTGKDEEWKAADLSARSIGLNANGTERPEAPIARWLMAVAAIVLLVACANVANLLMVRSMRRQREVAVRLALGISRSRLARLLVLESMMYSLAGGAAGIGVAYAGGDVMRRTFLSSVVWTTSPVSGRVLLVAVVLTIITGLAVGLAPMFQAGRTDILVALRGASSGAEPRQSRVRSALMVIQVAFSVTLLIGAGLFMRSLAKVRALDLGLQPDRVLVGTVGWRRLTDPSPAAAAAERTRQTNTWLQLRERIAHEPGVDHAALAIGSPFGFGFGVSLKIPGRDTLPSAPGGGPYINAVSYDYFATVGTPLVRGRAFGPNDGAQSERVAIVNETMAKLLWPTDNPLGKCLIVGDDETRCSTVVGIVRDARRYAIREEPAMQYYIPFGQESGIGGTVLLARPHGDARPFTSTLRRAIAGVVPDANIIKVSSMQDRVDPQIRPWRLGATMFGLFGTIALIVAAIGLYSVISYVIALRTHEFGVRIAVGASTRHILGGVLGSGLRVAMLGAAVGLVAAALASRWVQALLFDESPHDPVVYAGVAMVLMLVALAACLVPARRAARVDPVVALRDN
jgi:predicted permease